MRLDEEVLMDFFREYINVSVSLVYVWKVYLSFFFVGFPKVFSYVEVNSYHQDVNLFIIG